MTEPQAQASWMLLPRFSKHDSGSESTQVNSESLQSLTWVLILRGLVPPADETYDEKSQLVSWLWISLRASLAALRRAACVLLVRFIGFSQISRYQLFISLILERYEEVKQRFLENQ